jgi:quinolinate synthase
MEQKANGKKIPMRQCLGCNEHKPKIELLRVLRTPEGEIVLALQKELPEKCFYPAKEDFCCTDMKKNTLATLFHALQTEEYEIVLEKDVLEKAQQALQKMINL